tara:strand:- start:245 stop:1363 length:1119 start_codon:yes stop_codon:yes gene_type:complete
MSSLLEEAIVDAKALKEAALKNAEGAVLEKYSAEVRGALSTLLEQDELGLGEDVDEATADPSFLAKVPYGFQNEKVEGPDDDALIEIDFHELKTRIELEEAEGDMAVAEDLFGAEAVAPDLAAPDLALEEADQNPVRDMELDNDADVAATADDTDPDLQKPVEEDMEIDLSEEMISNLVEELVVDMKAVPDGWASGNSADNMIVQANNEAIAAAAGAHLKEDEELEEKVDTAPDVVSTDGLNEAKIATFKKSTRELRALLIESKSQLTQLNLENAKLVYQNKALNSASLNERQKKQIVEAVQSANSVEETSMIFETIQNAVGTSLDQRTRPQTLREAVTRPTSILLSSKKRNNEATYDPKMARMLRLAGLNK